MRPIQHKQENIVVLRKSPNRNRDNGTTSPKMGFVPKLPGPIRTMQSPSGQIIEIGSNLANWENTLTPISIHIHPAFESYNGAPIVLVDDIDVKDVCSKFKPGTYGFSVVANPNTDELCLIQIYDLYTVYVFQPSSLSGEFSSYLLDFFRDGSKLKIGVGIERDSEKLTNFIRNLRVKSPTKSHSVPQILLGTVDVKNLARACGEVDVSFEKLCKIFVLDYELPSYRFRNYKNFKEDDYIYFANEAVAGLKMYSALIRRYSPLN